MLAILDLLAGGFPHILFADQLLSVIISHVQAQERKLIQVMQCTKNPRASPGNLAIWCLNTDGLTAEAHLIESLAAQVVQKLHPG